MDRPWEEEDHCRGAFRFRGADGSEDSFEVVTAHSRDGIFALDGGVEDGEGAVVFEGRVCCWGHDCGLFCLLSRLLLLSEIVVFFVFCFREEPL